MERSKTLSLGEFRQLTKDLPDDTAIMIVSENNNALALSAYPFETSLDKSGVFLLNMNIYESVHFTD